MIAVRFAAAFIASPNLRHPRSFSQQFSRGRGVLVHPSSSASARKMAMMSSSLNSDADNHPSDVCIRILCLHGKGGNGEQFVDSALRPLRTLVEKRFSDSSTIEIGGTESECNENKFSFQWEALTAPYELIPGDESGGYSWWTMAPGVRSYNAEEYEGFDKSEGMVMDKVFSKETNDNKDLAAAACNFDIILGHSQGAILTAALLSIHDNLRKSSHNNNAPLGYILNGVAWPNPYKNALKSLKSSPTQSESRVDSHSPPLLFIMGKNDNINPIESAMQVHDAYQAAGTFNASIVNHNGGHSVPVGGDEDSVRALEEVVDWIVDIAKVKARRLGN